MLLWYIFLYFLFNLQCTQYAKHDCLKYNDIRNVLIGYIIEDETATYRSLANKMLECYNIDPSDSHSCGNGNADDGNGNADDGNGNADDGNSGEQWYF